MTAPPESYREIPLSKGQVALVDVEDYERLLPYTWYAMLVKKTGKHYAARRGGYGRKGTTSILMHREIMGCVAGDGVEVDHVDTHLSLDNRKHNLRKCTHAQNCRNTQLRKDNTSGFKGVYPSGRKWYALIKMNGNQTYLGARDTKEEAYQLYCEAAKERFGEFANFGHF